jgi:predicted Rossmann-fold nucleotide-binding protein
MKTEIDQKNYASWIGSATTCKNIVFQALDLTNEDETLASLTPPNRAEDGCVFLGCIIGPKFARVATSSFALIFPKITGRPYIPFRSSLYEVEELYDKFDPARPESFAECTDWRTFISYIVADANGNPVKPLTYVDVGPDEVLARRLHDNFISDELDEFLEEFAPGSKSGRGVVAITGGHDRKRSHERYRQVALIARELTVDGFLVVSGGGPGLMEAANLGAFLAKGDESLVNDAINAMAAVADDFGKNFEERCKWIASAWAVRKTFIDGGGIPSPSLGVPTWFYGWEPPNVFSTHIAKYFENSIREEGLLAIATHGVIFAEGNAGTTQEIFQDACQNYYDTYGYKSPMVLLGRASWDPAASEMSDDPNSANYYNKPAWPLLAKLARIKKFEHLISITDSVADVLSVIRKFTPQSS